MKIVETGWVQCPLEKLTSLIKDGTHGTHKDIDDGIPLLSAKDVHGGIVEIPYACRRISKADYESIHKKYEIEPKDILLTVVGTIGRCYIMRGTEPRFSIQRSVAVIRADGVKPEYLYQYIRSRAFQENLKEFTNASAQGGVYLGSLAKCMVKLPTTLPEQTKIAEILSTVDQAIEQTEALIAKQQRVKTGLMQDLLTRGIDEHGNLRSEQTHQFKDSPLGRIPVEWDVLLFKQIVTITRLAGYEYSTYWLPVENGEIITLRGYNIGKNKIIEREFERISERLSQRLIRSRLFNGDVVFPCVGTIGNAALIKEDNRYHINQNIAKITPGPRVDGSYLVHYLMSELCRIEIDRFNASSSQPNVLVGSLRQFRISIPSDLKEQQSISEKLHCHDAVTDQESARLMKLRSLKTALMQDLLTGKKRVTPLLNDRR